MVFSSLSFLFVFLPLLLLVYFCPLCAGRGAKNGVLLIFSLAFYSCGGWRLMPIILISILLNYTLGRRVAPGRGERGRKQALILAVAGNLGILLLFKYMNFLTYNLQLLVPALPVTDIVLPIGISFYTFQSLSYVIDVYRGQALPEKSLLRVALYIVFFPQLIAGPIVRYTTIETELRQRRETLEEAAQGGVRFLYGLAKKVLLSNAMGQIADAAFSQKPDALSCGLAWLGVAAYTAQIYFDFSGYSDMAIGLGRIFGFHFPENFKYPYISQSVTEFWRRWHISLSTWFRDYLYIPLGGNRCSLGRQIVNLLIVWTLTGFWHGAQWTFLLWGAWYALLLIGERYLWGDAFQRLPRPLRHGITLLLVMLGWLLFRAEGLTQVGQFAAAMAGQAAGGLWSGQVTYLLLQFRWELILAVLCALPVKLWLQTALEARKDRPLSRLALGWGVPILALGLGVLSVMQLIGTGFNPFIYFQF